MDTNHHDETREMTVTEPRDVVTQSTTALIITPVAEIVQRLEVVRELRREVMKDGVHFGQYPGWEKPALLQSGGDILRMTFNLSPKYTVQRDVDVEEYVTESGIRHRGYLVEAQMQNMSTGQVWGIGEGSCSTLESKYRWRNAKRSCPACDEEGTINKSKYSKSDKDYWYCRTCKANFAKDDPAVVNQVLGKMENPDIADQYNTVLKIAKKRAFLDAILNATGAREMFSSRGLDDDDDDDLPTPEQRGAAMPQQAPPQPQQQQPPRQSPPKRRDPQQLFAAMRRAGLTEDQFRAYLATRFEKESTKDLTPDEFDTLLLEIEDGTVKQFLAMPEGAGE